MEHFWRGQIRWLKVQMDILLMQHDLEHFPL